MKNNKPSLKDVANKAGVSSALVSYVLNGRMKGRIKKETAEKIRKVAKELNYRPNQIAKSLQSKKTHTIGLIVADIANIYSSQMARIIEDEAEKIGHSVIFGSADESVEKACELVNIFLSKQVEGLVIAAPAGFEKHIEDLKKQNVPLVLIDRYFPEVNVNYVATNDYDVSFEAGQHLIENGFENAGVFNYKTDLYHLNERTRGFVDAFALNDLSIEDNNIMLFKEKEIEQVIPKELDQMLGGENPVEALYFTSNKIATISLAYLTLKEIRVPEELAVICFDETRYYKLFKTPLTYIKQPLKEIGETAMKLLVEEINGSKQIDKAILESEMVSGRSSIKSYNSHEV